MNALPNWMALALLAGDADSHGAGTSPVILGAWAFLLLALALALIILEFLIPSLGLIALVSVALAVSGGILSYRAGVYWLIAYSVVAAVGTPVMIMLGAKLLKRVGLTLSSGLIPGGAPKARGDKFAVSPAKGATGVAETVLRPAGKARIGGRLVDVVADREFIEKDTPIRVVQVDGNRVVVRQE